MTKVPLYGYPSVESLVFAFVKASQLFASDHPAYTDVRQLAAGKRRLYASLGNHGPAKSNAKDMPALATLLEEELAAKWATDEIAAEVATRLSKHVTSYLNDFVRTVSAANIPTHRVMDVLRATYFAQQIAVDLSWFDQKWGCGLLARLLPKDGVHENISPVAVALRWMRKVEGHSAAGAAERAGLEPVDVVDIMGRWESGKQAPRRDSFELIKRLYWLNENPRYRFWFWIALVLDAAGPEFRREIAGSLGRGFDLASARHPFIELSNSYILRHTPPESFVVLERLLCRQSTNRAVGDLAKAHAALEDLQSFVAANAGIAEYHIYAMEARIAVFSRKPELARDCFRQAMSLARYAEPTAAERILREFAALCAHESFAIPLKDTADTQWLFGLHPVQIRRMPLSDDETLESATEMKRVFDYYRYFPPQSFFPEFKPPLPAQEST